MFITLKQARDAIAPYVGKSGLCASDERVRVRVLELVERLLQMGSSGSLRKWCFHVCCGCFTAPPELEVPLKVTIDGWPDRVWSKWYEFYDASRRELANQSNGAFQIPAHTAGVHEEPNEFYTIYEIPKGGARIAAVAFDQKDEDEKASLIVQGEDIDGNQIYTEHKGERQHGETLFAKKSRPTYSTKVFTRITGITKSRSVNYIRLYWFKPTTNEMGLLGQYRPDETVPSYRRFRVEGLTCDRCAKVSVIGRVRVLDHYHDNDILPVANLTALRELAMSEQASENEKIQESAFHYNKASRILEDENEYRKTGHESAFDIGWETSPANMENLV